MEDVKIMTKDEILGIDDKVIQTLQIPEWKDQWVCMKNMTGSERDSWEADVYVSRKKNEMEGMLDFRARLVAKCLCDREGKLLFTAKEIKALSAKSAKVLDRLFDLAQTMNGMKKEDLEKMTENLPEGQTAD